ncbi:hypothetical protein D9758_007723 [Tetrapyrgos nigripes]|uniref:AAA+ ATPase domain-containing protein n=1 Tax=Tetrapyrgos nigripes TaxID=182062 RepID=A0A8H5LIP0_9AGAR|nr:hypothetical protein D9758_007723 [Tetrapyrgos nigripes]
MIPAGQPQFYYSPNPQTMPPLVGGMQTFPPNYIPGMQTPQYRPRRRRHRRRNDSADTISSDSDKESVQPEYEDTIEPHEHYTVRFQKWHTKKNIYVPFDPRNWKAEPVVEKDTDTYFFVNSRHMMPGVVPQLYLSDWSDPLLYFLRSSVGGNFFQPNPERILEEFFPEVERMKISLENVRNALKPDSKLKLDEKVELAKSIGRSEAALSQEDELMKQFSDLAKHLEILLSYVTEKRQPLLDRLALIITYGQMEFDLLQYFFKKDDVLVTTTDDSSLDPPVAFKVISSKYDRSTSAFLIAGENYEWSGYAYISRRISRRCIRFSGTKDISALPFVHLTPEVKETLIARGKLYTTYSGVHFMSYYNNRVMIDRIGWNTHSGLGSWAPPPPSPGLEPAPANNGDPWGSPPEQWNGPNTPQWGMNNSPGGNYDDPQFPNQAPPGQWGQAPMNPATNGKCSPEIERFVFRPKSGKEVPTIDDEMLCFLPADVYGFDLGTKQWITMSIEKLKPVTFDEGAWDHLVLDDRVKTLIKGLVEVTRKQNDMSDLLIKDVIKGKGGGLVCVLHGPPGTGKTLTAEAVAELLRRPLYIAGSTELTTDPTQLESKLSHILNLAMAWDAVVLVDEADVFLEQRSLHELERNSLVSAVLRLLEYHRGVLFLTTNRIKAFDHAFMSRISIAIKYPELDHAGRYSVWSKFFALAGYEVKESSDPFAGPNTFLRVDVEELASKPFNGRTIKNLVRTAQALALSTNSPLKLEHVHVVVSAQEKFLDEFAGMKI